MSTRYTPGPWFADKQGGIWRRHPGELYENGGGVAGDKPLAFVNEGWIGEGLEGYSIKANAALIAAAPDMYEALKAVLRVADRATVEFDAARDAIAKAEGRG